MDKSNIFIKSVQYVDKDGNPLSDKQYINKPLDEWQKEIDEERDRVFTHETTDLDRYRCYIESDPWYEIKRSGGCGWKERAFYSVGCGH